MQRTEGSVIVTSAGADNRFSGNGRNRSRLPGLKHLFAASSFMLLAGLCTQVNAWTVAPSFPEFELDPSEFPGGEIPLELTLFSGFISMPTVDNTTVYAPGVPDDFPAYLRNLDLDVEVRGHARSENGITHVVAKTHLVDYGPELLEMRQRIGAALVDNGWKVLTPQADVLLMDAALLCHDTEGSMMVSFYKWAPYHHQVPESEHWIGLIVSTSPYADDVSPYISCGEERRLFPLRQPLHAFMQQFRNPAYGLLELPEGVSYDSWVGWYDGNTILTTTYHSTHSLYQSFFNQLRDQGWSEVAREYDDRGYDGHWVRTVALPLELQVDGRTEAELDLILQLRPLGDRRHEFQVHVETDVLPHSRVRVADAPGWLPFLTYPLDSNGTIVIPVYY